jgi:uncharacterized protein
MMLVDTGPLVALFDRQDAHHRPCAAILEAVRDPLVTTTPVLTEAFHMLGPAGRGAQALREFVERGGLRVWHFDRAGLTRAFELMERYGDHPMDLADASLVVAGESLDVRRIFTIDRDDFLTYKLRRGHRYVAFEVVSPAR